jgi:hypothetical protein
VLTRRKTEQKEEKNPCLLEADLALPTLNACDKIWGNEQLSSPKLTLLIYTSQGNEYEITNIALRVLGSKTERHK